MSWETILLVDDEETDREGMRHILQGEGYTVVEASSYENALGVFDRNRNAVHLLLLDISLPDGNGCDLAIALKTEKPDLRVLFVSGHVGAEVCRFYGLDVSDEHYLRKPFAPADLLSRVKQVMKSVAPFPKFCDPPQPKTRTAG